MGGFGVYVEKQLKNKLPMNKINICDENGKEVFSYESDIAPMAGDIYAGWVFEDLKGRTITYRQLHTIKGNSTITVYTKITHPNLHQ